MKMAKIIHIFLIGMFINITLFAQVPIYYEDFLGGIPAGYKFFNHDTLTPEPPGPNNGFRDFSSGTWSIVYNPRSLSDSAMASTTFSILDTGINSPYNGEKIDDWMITDSIVIGSNTVLRWESYSSNYEIAPLTYEVYISNANGDTTTDFTDRVFLADPDSGDESWRVNEIFLRDFGYQNETIYIAYRHNTTTDFNNGREADILYIDDIELFNVLTTDAAITSSIEPYVLAGSDEEFDGLLYNNGVDTINSFDLNYTIDNGTIKTHTYSNVAIAYRDSFEFTHDSIWNVPSSGAYSIQLWVDNVNGLLDENPIDDTINLTTYGVSKIPVKNVLVENITDASCGFCVDGLVALEDIRSDIPRAIITNIHYDDAMAIDDGIIVTETYDNAPENNTALIDRKKFDDQVNTEIGILNQNDNLWRDKITERADAITPVEVSMNNTMDSTSRELTINVNAKFYAPVSGNYRFNCYIVEDNISKDEEGYAQLNLRNTSPGHPYEDEGDTILEFVHQDVLRAMLGGPFGQNIVPANPFPLTINEGDSFKISYTYTVPPEWDATNITLVSLIQKINIGDQRDRTILNAVDQPLVIVNDSVTSVNEIAYNKDISILKIYPNPATNYISIDIDNIDAGPFDIVLFDLIGNKVGELKRNNNIQKIDKLNWDLSSLNLSSGYYMLSIKQNGYNIASQKLMISAE